METNNTLYTYGDEKTELSKFIHLLKHNRINCVVDIRENISKCNYETKLLYNSTKEAVKEEFRTNNIYYLDFHSFLGKYSFSSYNKRGCLIYDKAVVEENFIKGIERLKVGIHKGYSIIILEKENTIYNSIRFNIIGRFLAVEGYNINHFKNEHEYNTHQQLLAIKSQQELRRKNKKDEARSLGRTGEEIAALYLMKNGFQILDRNWNLYKGCELDIVARKDNKIHFIEVKTRSSDKYGSPQMAINRNKMKNIGKAIQQYRYKNGFYQIEHQIDSIGIVYHNENDYTLEYYPDIRIYYTPNYNIPYTNR